jgi:ectoine hydroxylase-related dioxygenase (phytanoyl-CoA dioxygenase family)
MDKPQRDLELSADRWTRELSDKGYCVIEELVPQARIQALHADLRERLSKTPFSVGEFHGERSKRCGSLLIRSVHAEGIVRHPLVLEIVDRVLSPYCDCVQLNLTQAIELHPGAEAQPPHRDHDLWRAQKGQMEFQVNVMWPLTEFTAANGATIVWPGSHKRLSEFVIDQSEAIAPEMDPGSALLFLGSVLHCGGANRTSLPRTGVIISYCLGWLKPYENQWLAYPPEVAKDFAPELAALVGYRQHRPNLGSYEGQSPAVLLSAQEHNFLGAVDALAPEHVEFIHMLRERLARCDQTIERRPLPWTAC